MANTKSAIDDDKLKSIISSQIDDARLYDGKERASHRDWALRFFNGEIDIPAMGEGRSTFVSKDVADTHGLILPGLLRVFFASDRIAVYEPTKPQHEQYAEQATDLVNYVVRKECDGYRQFRDACSDALLLGNGIIKHWWDKTPVYKTESYSGLRDDQYAFITRPPEVAGKKIEVIEHKEYPDPDWERPEVQPELEQAAQQGNPEAQAMLAEILQMPPPTLHDFKTKTLKSKGRLALMAVPAEEFLIERSAKVLDEEVRFCAHVQRVTRSQLVKEGYDKDKVDEIPLYSNFEREQERDTRDNNGFGTDKAPDKSTEYVERYECYVLMDYDGDGIAERRKIVAAGSGAGTLILSNDEWGDDLPFSDIVPDPRAHVWKGQDLYNEVGDVQRIKSIGVRGLLDNFYEVLNPQRDVVAGAYENMDAVIDRTFGAILLRTQGFEPLQDYAPVSIAPNVMPVLDYFDGVVEKRTGISQRSMALDLDALQNQSATAVNATQSAIQSKIEEYARNIAECGGMQRIFSCVLRLIVKHQDDAKTIRLRGSLVAIDPQGWDADMDVTIDTGLGTGSRERDLSMLQGIAAKQEQYIMQSGDPYNDICNIGHLFATYRKMAEAANIKNPESYFPVITQDQVTQMRQQRAQAAQNQPQDPKLIEIDRKYALEEQKMNAQLAMQQARDRQELELQTAKSIREVQLEIALAKIKAESDQEKEAAQMRADLAVAAQQQAAEREKITLEYQQKLAEMNQERELELYKLGVPIGGFPDPTESTRMLMDGIGKLGEMIGAIGKHIAAPVVIDRDPVTGRASGARRVVEDGGVQ